METEGSLPRSQEPATSSYSESDHSCPHRPSYSLKMHFNIILHLRLRIASYLLLQVSSQEIPLRTYPPHHSHTAFLLVRQAIVTKSIQFRCSGGGGSLLSIKMYGIFRTCIWKSWRKVYNIPVRSASASYIQLRSIIDVLRLTICISWNWGYKQQNCVIIYNFHGVGMYLKVTGSSHYV